MSLVVDVFSHWRNPVIQAQRKWLLSIFWGRTSNWRMIWFLAYLLLLCCMWLWPVKFVFAMYFPLAFLSVVPAMNIAEVVAKLKTWRLRGRLLNVVIAQALLLHWSLWSLFGFIVWYRTSSPTVLVLMGFVSLLMQFIAFAMPSAFLRRNFTPAQGQTWQVQLAFAVIFIPLFALFLYPQYEPWIRAALLLCSVGLLAGLLLQIQRFGRPRLIEQNKLAADNQHATAPAKSPLLFRIEMNLGFALDAKGWRKLLNSLVLTPYGMIWAFQHFLPIQGGTQWGAGAIFAMQTGAFLAYFSGRRHWSNAWLSRSNSRGQLWLQDELIFAAALLLIVGLNCALLLLLRMDGITQIINAALMFVAGMAFLRYLILSLPWLNLFGLNANGRTDMQGFGVAFIFMMPIWLAVAWIWGGGVQDQIELMIFCFAAPVPILAYFAYRFALKIDLGAMRRAKLN